MAVKVFLLMILLHVIDDFHLQGIFGSMKQKEWWKNKKDIKTFINMTI